MVQKFIFLFWATWATWATYTALMHGTIFKADFRKTAKNSIEDRESLTH